LEETNAISIPEKNAESSKQIKMILISIAVNYLFRLSILFKNRLLKKNIKIAMAAKKNINQGLFSSEFKLAKP
jgi:hypothetical protein